ncbi:hypothetical protein EV702DRAFT_1253447 [Suillus placidus]|uniref:Uncharacterized protein n=1 Tax=Suillus placidus TaxID=48579 RepID=A0A9P7CXK8_9AGAM|nr:hypothetical protein EV702DRAFT_1253447 [Suillus placidus]
MFNEDCTKSEIREPISSLMTESVDEEEEVDELVDNDSPSYDLGWHAIHPSPDNPSASGDSMFDEHEDQGPISGQDNNGPAYDLGWGQVPLPDQSTSETQPDCDKSESEADGPVYDLGWGELYQTKTAMSEAQPDCSNSGSGDDGPAYDLGWGQVYPVDQPMQEEVVGSDDRDRPAYDLRWGVGQTNNTVDLTDEDGPSYDVGWGVEHAGQTPDVIDLTMDETPAPLSDGSALPAPMDLDDDDDRDGLPSGTMEYESMSTPERLMFQANRRMKAIGNDMTDLHMHAIVENAVYGLNSELAPGQILLQNRHILSTFTDARNRVTAIGCDMCNLHQLIQLQCGLLRTINHVIGSLENDVQ